MVDACAMHGIYAHYGPFGDIADVVACEDQFRNAFLLGCVGAWSLHPKQIAIANKVFSPSVEDVAHARRVVEAMGDGTGAVMLDGKMEDDASLKQCLVMVELAERLAAVDPELKAQYDAIETVGMSDATFRARRSVLYMPSSNAKALEKAKALPCRRASSSTSRTPSPPTPSRPPARRLRPRSSSGEYGAPRADDPRQRHRHRVARRRPRRRGRRPGRTPFSCPRSDSAEQVRGLATALEWAGAPAHTRLWAMIETPVAILHAEEIAARLRPARLLRHGHQRPGQGALRRARPRPGAGAGLAVAGLLAARAAGIAILDGVYNDVKDTDGFAAECRQGREFGFDGKTLIHPGQIEAANERSRRPSRPSRTPAASCRRGRTAGLRRRHLPRPDDREPARRVGPAHPGDRGGHRRPELTRSLRATPHPGPTSLFGVTIGDRR